jgi:hypothetical protein
MATTYKRITTEGGSAQVSNNPTELLGVLVTSETSSTCDLVIYDSVDKDVDRIALHLVANGNSSTSMVFPDDKPLILLNGCYMETSGSLGRGFVYYDVPRTSMTTTSTSTSTSTTTSTSTSSSTTSTSSSTTSTSTTSTSSSTTSTSSSTTSTSTTSTSTTQT